LAVVKVWVVLLEGLLRRGRHLAVPGTFWVSSGESDGVVKGCWVRKVRGEE
jgi:hypothetical protein